MANLYERKTKASAGLENYLDNLPISRTGEHKATAAGDASPKIIVEAGWAIQVDRGDTLWLLIILSSRKATSGKFPLSITSRAETLQK